MGMASDGGEARKKILVVDDEEPVRGLCTACIRHALGQGYDVVEAANGVAAMTNTPRESSPILEAVMQMFPCVLPNNGHSIGIPLVRQWHRSN